MIDGGAALAAKGQQLLVARAFDAGIELFDRIGRKRRRAQNLAQDLQALDKGGAVALACQIVDPNFRRLARVCASDPKRTTALGAKLAHRGGEAGERMELFAHLVSRKRKEMNLNVRCRKARIGLEERSRGAG